MNNQENGFWECSGDENNRHILRKMSPEENECREPGCSKRKPRPKTRIKPPKPEPDGIKNHSYSTNNNGNNGNNRSNIPTDSRYIYTFSCRDVACNQRPYGYFPSSFFLLPSFFFLPNYDR